MIFKLSRFFSWIFQPLLMPLFGAIIFLNLPFYAFSMLNDQLRYFVLICTALFTVVLPMLSIILMKHFGIIDSIQLNNRADRKYPILLTIIFQFANFYYLGKIHLPTLYYFFLIAGIFSLLTTLLITYYWKISIHMTGIGGLLGAMFMCTLVWHVDMRLILAGLFLIAGIIGSSRLILKAHNSAQIAAGFVAGFCPQAALILLVN